MARTYPDTPAGRSRRLKDADDALMSRRGHRMSWKRWRKGTISGGGNWLSAPGWEGVCTRCWDTVHVVSLSNGAGQNGSAYTSYTDANGTHRSFRQCRGGRR
jgi:hypothetical protein